MDHHREEVLGERIERQLLRREPVRYEAPVRGQLDLRHQAGGFYF